MSETRRKYTFGPVPSRRLGLSLGVNNIPFKHCSYSCIYCQAGETINLIIDRREFYDPYEISSEVINVVDKLEKKPDYITFVPDGEPTLDINLGKEAELIKESINIPLAILTNSSLLYRDDVRRDLMIFDLVSLKIDTVYEQTFKKINRPHKELSLKRILEGIVIFSDEYKGTIITETMLVADVNTHVKEYLGIAEFLKKIKVSRAYIMIPTRPPALKWVKPPADNEVITAYDVFVEKLGRDKVYLTTSYEGTGFVVSSRDFINEIMNIISVHPLRLDYFEELARQKRIDPKKILDMVLKQGLVELVEYGEHKFLVKKR
ncbi:radical SAM protein [Desulfurococcaceae archaeon MEX13E-LK6-19]|nr:radical SAM protein [Desulfurococcaceae archaeon MEX13E-LK6-19]